MNIFVIFPARIRFKGVKNKYISLINGKPLFAFNISSEKIIAFIDSFFCSSDIQSYAEIKNAVEILGSEDKVVHDSEHHKYWLTHKIQANIEFK